MKQKVYRIEFEYSNIVSATVRARSEKAAIKKLYNNTPFSGFDDLESYTQSSDLNIDILSIEEEEEE